MTKLKEICSDNAERHNLNNKTFQYKGLTIELHLEVYEPSEDTFQVIEAVDVKKTDKVLEIGTGSGLISLVCAQIGADVICSDINPFAVELAKRNFLVNESLLNGSYEIRIGNLFEIINFEEKFDVIIFNPPYLPTKKEEKVGGSGWFDVAVDGGTDGLKVTKKFIENVSKYLEESGRAYFVFSSLSDRKKLENCISKVNLNSEIVDSRRYDDELIDIYRLSL